ncbi:MAG: hopanoid biosynthesis-associated protein HpnK [Gammaproteobacteria bacterium]
MSKSNSGDNSKTLIVTADDFGLSVPVNEAVERAHLSGILTAASLMVSGHAFEDAVMRARRLPSLGVGLHIVLVDGRPVLPPEQLPDLVGADGRFLTQPVRTGLKLLWQHRLQVQVEAEIRAQLQRFKTTGLNLDHVDGHHHFHQHPFIIDLLIRLAPEFGIKAVRVPIESPLHSWRAQREGWMRRFGGWFWSVARLRSMQEKLRRAGVACNDQIFGLFDSGRMNAQRMDGFLAHLPAGITELYCHPATRRWAVDCLPESYQCDQEFSAIADPERRQRVTRQGIRLVPFAALAQPIEGAL